MGLSGASEKLSHSLINLAESDRQDLGDYIVIEAGQRQYYKEL